MSAESEGFGYTERSTAKRLAPLMSAARDNWKTPDSVWTALRALCVTLEVTLIDSAPPEHTIDSLRGPRWGEGFADGLLVYCNPPYGGRGKRGITAWVERARNSAAPVVMLLPARTDARWFPWDADAHTFFRGRVRFVDPETNRPAEIYSKKRGKWVAAYAPFPSVLTLHVPTETALAFDQGKRERVQRAFAEATSHFGVCLRGNE